MAAAIQNRVGPATNGSCSCPTFRRSDLTISVVIPVLDDADMLRRCLRSLADQHVAPSEVIVVDNGSSDDTARVAADHGALVVVEPRRGIGHAAATGYDSASGQIVARCDADSVLPPDWLARIRRPSPRTATSER